MNPVTAEHFDPFVQGLVTSTSDVDEFHAFAAYLLAWRVLDGWSQERLASIAEAIKTSNIASQCPIEWRTAVMLQAFGDGRTVLATHLRLCTNNECAAVQALCELNRAKLVYRDILQTADAETHTRLRETGYRALLNAVAAAQWAAWGRESDLLLTQTLPQYAAQERRRAVSDRARRNALRYPEVDLHVRTAWRSGRLKDQPASRKAMAKEIRERFGGEKLPDPLAKWLRDRLRAYGQGK